MDTIPIVPPLLPSTYPFRYFTHILYFILQGREANQKVLASANGLDVVLMSIVPFKSRDPADEVEQETLENLFDVLCCCLMTHDQRAAFVKVRGGLESF